MDKEALKIQISQNLSTWEIAKLSNTTQANVRYWLKKYNLETTRTTNDRSNYKLCPSCNISKPRAEFYYNSITTKNTSYCKSCLRESNCSRRRIAKQQAIEYLGGKCSRCGYNKCNAALDFHHIDPTIKDVDYSRYKLVFNDRLKTELNKCVLLCSNCHREEHSLLSTEP